MSNPRPRRIALAAALAALGALLSAWTAAAAPARPAAKQATVVTVGSTDLGRILIDTRGRTLYLYTPDTKGTSTCYGQCASFWPPLLAPGRVRGAHGVKASLLGTTKRKDGKLQVTYAGHPLYYFAQDNAPGDVNGQGLQNIWYAVSVTGKRVAAPAPPATVSLGKTALGSVIVDARGMTLYLFTPDTATTSVCNGACASLWPPLLADGKLRAAGGLETSLLGTIARADGSRQVTYAGHPLYYFAKDAKAGDANGQGLNAKWYVLSSAGAAVTS
jgi:predicted lipoprotein with Yx(FWY)xxD motif